MSQAFECPNCGAPLDYQGDDPIIRCPYCASSVIVPENLRAKPSFSNKPSNFTLSGLGDMGGLINQARRIKEVKDLAQAGETDRAVALYREITGQDEASARQSVGALASNRPVTFTGMPAIQVVSSTPIVTSMPSVQIKPVDDKTSKTIGRAVGCFIAIIVVTVLISVLVPVLGTALGLFAAFQATNIGDKPSVSIPSIPGIEIPGVSIPGASGYATQELSFGGEGSGPGLFGDVRAIGVNPANSNIYAAHYDDGRVQAFDAQGKFLTQWIIKKELTDPYFGDMAVDRSGTVYIPVFGKILKFDGNGKLLGEIAIDEYRFSNLDIASDGALVAIANGEDVVWLTIDGQITQELKAAVSTVSGDSELNSLVAVDGLGNVYVLGTFNNAIFVFSPEGKFINRFGSAGDENGQFRAPMAIEVDGRGRIFVSDIKGIQVFSNDGRYINVIKVQYVAYGVAFDDQGKLYVTTNQKKIEKYSVPQD